MHWLRRLLLLLPGPRRRRARELDEELKANLSLALDDAADPDAARRARVDFGSITRAHEEARAVWFPGWDPLSQDVKFAVRTLARAPGFTLVAVLSLALGSGAATALFSLVNTVTLKPLAYAQPGRLVTAREVVPPLAHIYPTLPVNMEHFLFWRDHASKFESLAAFTGGTAMLTVAGEPEVVGVASVTAGFFELLGAQPQLGRPFRPEEEKRGKNAVAIITDGLWRRQFAASPSVIGQTLRLNGYPLTVVGVLPASFRFPRKDELGPLTHLPERTGVFTPVPENHFGWAGDYDYIVVGRLRPGATLAQGRADLNLLESRITAEHAEVARGLHAEVRQLQDVISSPVRASLAVLLAAVMVLVLIVCVNLANLLLARGSARAREISLRIALGAGRARLLFSALVETLLLSIAGGVLGLLAAREALAVFIRTAPVDLPRLDEVQIDGRVLAFAFGLSLLCALLFGLLPALHFSRLDPQNALRGANYTASAGRGGIRVREWLIGSEVALSTLLLVLAALLVTSLWHVLRVNPGFADEQALDIELNLPSRYNAIAARAGFFDLAAARIRELPGVRAVAAVNRTPLSGESNVNHVVLEGSDSGALDPVTRQLVMVNVRFISQDYFSALGIPLLRGRPIEAADRDRNVAVVSARVAAKLWPGQDPLGKVLSSGSGVQHAQVVGVVGDVYSTRLEGDPTLMIYVPYWKMSYQVADLAVRSAIDPKILPGEIRGVLQSIDSGIPAPKMRTMADLVAASVAQRRFQMRVAAAFAIAALLLAMLGIYGVVAYGVSLRRREFGIRMALGARSGEMYRLVIWRGLRPVAAGLATGMLAALAAGRLIRTLLFGVAPSNGFVLAVVGSGLICVAMIACLMPARSVLAIDPSRVLRNE